MIRFRKNRRRHWKVSNAHRQRRPLLRRRQTALFPPTRLRLLLRRQMAHATAATPAPAGELGKLQMEFGKKTASATTFAELISAAEQWSEEVRKAYEPFSKQLAEVKGRQTLVTAMMVRMDIPSVDLLQVTNAFIRRRTSRATSRSRQNRPSIPRV